MSFIQCKDQTEVEKKIKIGGFVSPDFRIYDTIDFYDDAIIHTIKAEDVNAFLQFKLQLECMTNKFYENPFQNIGKHAAELSDDFVKVAKHFGITIEDDDAKKG